jgi:hypothetical protein
MIKSVPSFVVKRLIFPIGYVPGHFLPAYEIRQKGMRRYFLATGMEFLCCTPAFRKKFFECFGVEMPKMTPEEWWPHWNKANKKMKTAYMSKKQVLRYFPPEAWKKNGFRYRPLKDQGPSLCIYGGRRGS